MREKEVFKRLSIDEMKKAKEQKELQEKYEQFVTEYEQQIELEAEKLAQELSDQGYDVDNFEIQISQGYDSENNKVIVQLKVVQVARELEFDLGGENKSGNAEGK